MKNPIPKLDLFATMELSELQEYIRSMSNGQEKALAFSIFYMTMNACHKEVEKEAVCS
jgi:hypothetical protein